MISNGTGIAPFLGMIDKKTKSKPGVLRFRTLRPMNCIV
jgi:sulfite reductase alpha subunit-like flavoprotein